MVRKASIEPVPPEEIERRIMEYRRLGLQGKQPPVVVYSDEQAQVCPWPTCGYRIVGVQFQLDKMGPPEWQDRMINEWWGGAGLLAPCPGCGRVVMFGLQDKIAVSEPVEPHLPIGWHELAHVLPKGGR